MLPSRLTRTARLFTQQRRLLPSIRPNIRCFSAEAAKEGEKTVAAPAATTPPPKPAAGVGDRLKSFTWGFLLAQAASFWFLAFQAQVSMENLRDSARGMLDYQRKLEERLDRLENAVLK